MKRLECEYESEVLAAVIQDRWPARAGVELQAHVAACAVCRDVATVAGAFEHAREKMWDSATVPDASRVWRVAQLRARREALESAGRPITAVQLFALACATGLLGASLEAALGWFHSAAAWVRGVSSAVDVQAFLAYAATLVSEHAAVITGTAAMVFLIPTAVYFALAKE